jgi:hypothetical protein
MRVSLRTAEPFSDETDVAEQRVAGGPRTNDGQTIKDLIASYRDQALELVLLGVAPTGFEPALPP